MASTQSTSGSSGWIAGAIVLGLLLLVAMCSAPKDKTAQSFASPSLTNQIETMAPPTPAPIAALSAGSLRTARQHLLAVAGAEGLSGAMIYSQNCYDALTRTFSWAKLDLCGGFDMLAVGAADNMDSEGLNAEATYFEPEAAAGRYLAVATKAGLEAGEADKRLEALQQHTAAMRPAAAKPKPTPEVEETPEEEDTVPVDNGGEQAET